MRYQQLAVRRVGRVVGDGQDMGGSTKGVHFERHDRPFGEYGIVAVRFEEKSSRTIDHVVDRVPAAYRVEPGIADPVYRPLGAHAVVERVWILDGVGAEELDRVVQGRGHLSRLTAGNHDRQWGRRRVEMRVAERRKFVVSPQAPDLRRREIDRPDLSHCEIIVRLVPSVRVDPCQAMTGLSAAIAARLPPNESLPRPPISWRKSGPTSSTSMSSLRGCTARGPRSTATSAAKPASSRTSPHVPAPESSSYVRRSVEGLSGPHRVIAAITVAIEQIRADPARDMLLDSVRGARGNAWFTDSPTVAGFATELTGLADDDPQAGQWIVRLVLFVVVLAGTRSRCRIAHA